MAVNPMQKKARNSMLIGVIIGLLIGCVGIAFFFMQATNYKKQIDQIAANEVTAYALKSDIKSGASITANDLIQVSASKDSIPADYLTINDITDKTISKLNLTKGLVLSKSMVTEVGEEMTSDLREQQYNMIVLPQYLDADSYIDIRLQLPNGQDFIVVSKKRIKQISEDTIWINMYEQETLTMSRAIVEAYIMKGSKLYATTYVPSGEVINLINADKNITDKAKSELNARYTEELRARRQDINAQINIVGEQAQSNLESGIEQEITKARENRKEYLDSLNVAE